MSVHRVEVVLHVVLAASLAVPGAAVRAAGQGGAESPEALVARLDAAIADRSLSELVACLAPRERAAMVASLLLAVETAAADIAETVRGTREGIAAAQEPPDPDFVAQIEAMAATSATMTSRLAALKERHGIPASTDGAAVMEADLESAKRLARAQATFGHVDHAAVLGELLALMEPVGGPSEEGLFAALPRGRLSDLSIDGDRATGRMGEGGIEIELVRLDGRWYGSFGDGLM
jgi:hypothetical protein